MKFPTNNNELAKFKLKYNKDIFDIFDDSVGAVTPYIKKVDDWAYNNYPWLKSKGVFLIKDFDAGRNVIKVFYRDRILFKVYEDPTDETDAYKKYCDAILTYQKYNKL